MSQSTIFQLSRDGSSWVEPILSKDKCALLKDTTQWCRWGSNPQLLDLQTHTLPLSSPMCLCISTIFQTCLIMGGHSTGELSALLMTDHNFKWIQVRPNTLEVVASFCYLGAMLSVVKCCVKSTWKKLRSCCRLSYSTTSLAKPVAMCIEHYAPCQWNDTVLLSTQNIR